MRITKALLGLAFASSLVACGPETITVTMNPQMSSGQSGKAVLTEVSAGHTKVEINLTGGNDTGSQPAHFHTGTCDAPGAVAFALTPVSGGKSTTDLTEDFEEFKHNPNKYVLNVHSSADATVYTSCGVVK